MAAFTTARQVLPGLEAAGTGAPRGRHRQLLPADGRLDRARPRLRGSRWRPAAGAAESPGGRRTRGARPPPLPVVAILSHEYWQRRYGGDPAVLGQRIPGGPRPEIVGVLAPGFELLFPPGTNVEQRPDFWIANRLNYNNANRNTFGLRPVGRLKPGVALARAQEEVDAISARIREQFPVSKGSGFNARLEPMHKTLVDEVRPAILALMGAVIFLLLIACANVANLLLVRASLRQPELAVRAALGAGRGRVVRQMLAEALVLTALGAAGGIALAWIGIRQLLSIAPANLPRLETIRIDPIVLLFALATSLAAACVFGMVPALSAFRMDLVNALGGAARTSGLRGGGRLFRNAVVVVEVALCFVLLVGSGLMIRSFLELQRIDPGFDPRGLLTFQLLGGGPAPNEQAPRGGASSKSGCARCPACRASPRRSRFRSAAGSAPSGGDWKTR